MAQKEITCMECNNKFMRDITTPFYKKLYAEMGCCADLCPSCFKKEYHRTLPKEATQ